jgi:hypothetical protein
MRAMEGIMPRKNLWNANLPRVELDQRVRDARLRLERIERLLVPRGKSPVVGDDEIAPRCYRVTMAGGCPFFCP